MKPRVTEKQPKTMLTPTGGFLSGYTHTLNPYGGCAFACTYCYVRRMPVALFRGDPWGEWVDAKRFDPDAFRRELSRAKRKGPVAVFMSSATDPYQPAEYRLKLTRTLLTIMAEDPPAFLFVQTRSPLVTRDADLFLSFPKGRIRVSVTVETDREDVRKEFAPAAPPIPARLNALRRLAEAGVPTQAAVAPLLPCSAHFAAALAGVTERVTLDTFALGDGAGGKRTEALGIKRIHDSLGLSEWYESGKYKEVWTKLGEHFPPDRLFLSQAGFHPDAGTL
ncbi:SPL family radical SAM protein [Paenibacillus alkalitolerans]|uniref:SPL family radical SAM protein n=1 Tax=Paenibacillus alkalitolerans TaxID=2799335 RepID=UPI0018F50094|nr:radical SAM protein [Paenibacillus alkalitolerans]